MQIRAGLLFLLVGALAVGCASAPTRLTSVAPSPEPAPPVSVPLGDFRGDGAQMGAEQGRQFRPVITQLCEKYLLASLQGTDLVEARMAAASFETFMLPEHRAEIQALAAATGINQYDIALAQCFLDLMPTIACSTIAFPAPASPDGVARFGRNLDFVSLGLLEKHSAVLVFHPSGKYQFAAIGWPGMIGLVSGMNEHGLCLASMEITRPARPPTAMPYMLLYRTILEQCRTVDEAIDLLNRTPRQTTNNLMLMDAAGNRAVAEIRPESVTVRRGQPGTALISTNHQRGQDTDTPGLCWRYDSLHAASARGFGHVDVPAIEKMLGNVVQGNAGDLTLQSMIFEPANRVVYLAVGTNAANRSFERIDLKPYFAEK